MAFSLEPSESSESSCSFGTPRDFLSSRNFFRADLDGGSSSLSESRAARLLRFFFLLGDSEDEEAAVTVLDFLLALLWLSSSAEESACPSSSAGGDSTTGSFGVGVVETFPTTGSFAVDGAAAAAFTILPAKSGDAGDVGCDRVVRRVGWAGEAG